MRGGFCWLAIRFELTVMLTVSLLQFGIWSFIQMGEGPTSEVLLQMHTLLP